MVIWSVCPFPFPLITKKTFNEVTSCNIPTLHFPSGPVLSHLSSTGIGRTHLVSFLSPSHNSSHFRPISNCLPVLCLEVVPLLAELVKLGVSVTYLPTVQLSSYLLLSTCTVS